MTCEESLLNHGLCEDYWQMLKWISILDSMLKKRSICCLQSDFVRSDTLYPTIQLPIDHQFSTQVVDIGNRLRHSDWWWEVREKENPKQQWRSHRCVCRYIKLCWSAWGKWKIQFRKRRSVGIWIGSWRSVWYQLHVLMSQRWFGPCVPAPVLYPRGNSVRRHNYGSLRVFPSKCHLEIENP